ncbi:c-type cytochrome [Dyadobacter flavalbus]|uniref:C-type cytochrome n=1 Tax=Dyadobacter flavalbus TaxID=2579942 RepID=A0A5M8R408_9BACT|nr:PQQ-dependent sugar dehydrogenase [Dyadobacter flavalbus]KAA6440882.1 c-type cytochrome [Dyadobacter flavalbus]
MNMYKQFAASLFSVAISTMPVYSQTTRQSLAEGQRLYTINCANCHGDAAQGAVKAGIELSIITERGGKQPPNLTDDAWDHGSTDAEIFNTVKKGFPSGMMPPFEGSLSDSQIKNVIAYVRSLSTPQGVAAAAAAKVNVIQTNAEHTIELADYLEMPITGDMSADRVTGVLARGSIMLDEPGGKRTFINDLNGQLYILDKQTKKLTTYLDFDGSNSRAGLFTKLTSAKGYASGLMNFVFDPDYSKNGIFYTLHMENVAAPGESPMPKAGVVPGLNLAGYNITPALAKPVAAGDPQMERELVIVEWRDQKIGNYTFEGTAREVLRLYVPGLFHPLNELTFNPAARPGDTDWRVMYLGIGDAGTGERPGPNRMHAQRLDTFQGKVLRIIPSPDVQKSTSTLSDNGQYRIPNDNPFVSISGARKEIWAYGLRNPHRLTWYIDPARPRKPILFAFNIGLVSWETVMIIKKGANYGYPLREGSQSMEEGNKMGPIPADDQIAVQVTDVVKHGTVKPAYAVLAYPHAPGGGDAIANGFVYRGKKIPMLKGTFVFGDITTGRIWYARIKDVIAADDGNPLTFAPIHELGTQIRSLAEETYKRRGGKNPGLPGRGAIAGAGRIDLRLAEDSEGELYVLTKADGMIRKIVGVK